MKKIIYLYLILFSFLLGQKVFALNVTNVDIVGDIGNSYDVTMGDIDNDGDIDIYVVNYAQQNKLWINDGLGNFISDDIAGDSSGKDTGANIADIDNDGDLDIYVTSYNQNRIWINDGLGNGGASFTISNIVGDNSQDITGTFIDIDGDHDNDLYVTILDGGQNKLWVNDGLGNGGASFSAHNIPGDTGGHSYEPSIGDVDGDGDLDIHVPNGTFQAAGEQNKLWINDGTGNFSSHDIPGDVGRSVESIMGDIDGDGDLDIYVSNWGGGQNKLWINDGTGNFSSHDIPGDTGDSAGARMADFNRDGNLDIYVANYGQNKLWINDGSGNFTADDITGDVGDSEEVIISDFDGNGSIDIYIANYNQQNRLWINNTPNPHSNTSKGSLHSPRSKIKYVCKDKQATNYSYFGRHKQSKCRYLDKTEALKCNYFTKYHKKGDIGGEILKIQKFLSSQKIYTGDLNAIMDRETLKAINVFQTKFFQDILDPWNLKKPTGYWYQSTRKKANELVGCDEGSVLLDNGILLK